MSEHRTGRPVHYVAWLVVERVVRGIATMAALAAVARYLSPAGFGVLNFANALIVLVVPLAQLGLDTVLVRELVKRPSSTGALMGTSFVLRLAGGVACAAALLGGSHYSSILRAAQPALGPMSLIAVVQAGEVVDCWFRSRVLSRTVVIVRGSVVIVGAAAKLALVAAGAGLVAFAWVYAVEAAAVVVGLYACVWHEDKHIGGWSFSLPLARELVGKGWGFALAAFVAGLSTRVDQIAVTGLLGDSAAGLYYGALRLIEPAIYVATVTVTALFPTLASSDEDLDFKGKLEGVFGIMSALAWMTAIGTTLIAAWVTPLLLGRAYHAAWPVLVIQAWATLFSFAGMVRGSYLTVRHAPGTLLAASLAALAIQVALNHYLVPAAGIAGAALAFLATQLAGTWLVPLALPALRPCLASQARGFLAPWRPSRWRSLLSIVHG
jgi:PST family polysaccharide transporter